MTRKEYFKKWNMTNHGDNPQLFEYDIKNDIIDVFIRRDENCPYPFTKTNKEDTWFHQGFYLDDFMMRLDVFLQMNDLRYRIVED